MITLNNNHKRDKERGEQVFQCISKAYGVPPFPNSLIHGPAKLATEKITIQAPIFSQLTPRSSTTTSSITEPQPCFPYIRFLTLLSFFQKNSREGHQDDNGKVFSKLHCVSYILRSLDYLYTPSLYKISRTDSSGALFPILHFPNNKSRSPYNPAGR